MSSLERRFYDLPDGRLSAVHFNPQAGAPQLVLLNANGFNAMCYRLLLEPLGVHTIAIDMRGHGFSELPADPAQLKNWDIFADDVAYFVKTYIESPILLVGHSFGGVVGTLASGRIRDQLSGFIAFDPPTLPGYVRVIPYLPGGRKFLINSLSIAKRAGRRRKFYPSKDAAFERYKDRGAFRHMPEEVLRDYIEGGLKPHEDGFALACDPKWEQMIYVAQGNNLVKSAAGLPDDSLYIYVGKGGVSHPRIRWALKRKLGDDSVIFLKDRHHLFPMNDPDAARVYIAEALQS